MEGAVLSGIQAAVDILRTAKQGRVAWAVLTSA